MFDKFNYLDFINHLLIQHFPKYTSDDERVMIIDQDMLYFGVKELCDSTRWNQQYSLIRTEETLDWALPKANRLSLIHI